MRRQSFLLFELGLRPAEVAAMLRTKRTNAYRYFQQWKRMPPLYQEKYQLMKGYFRKLNKRDRMALAQIFAVELGTSVEEVVNQMNKPWSTKKILTGEWREWPVKKKHINRRYSPENLLRRIIISLIHPVEFTQILKMAFNQNIKLPDSDSLI